MNGPAIDDLFRIDGKIALVTDRGGLSSIDIAPVLRAAGAQVIVADIDAHDARDAGSDRLAVDVTSEDAVAAMFSHIRARFGRLDILVNCAGMTANAPLDQTSMARFDEMQAVNARSTFMLMRDAVRLMCLSGDGGRIVNVTTIGSVHPVLHGNAAYGASRAAVTAMTRAVALDHAADGIRANLVLPGAVRGKTQFHPDLQARLSVGGTLSGPAVDPARLPFGALDARDIAAAVLFLAGPSGGYMTGQAITLDGGLFIT